MRAEQADELERATRSLNIELGELRATLAELRAVLATDKARKGDGIVVCRITFAAREAQS